MKNVLKKITGIVMVIALTWSLCSIFGISEKKELTAAAKNLLVNPGAEKGDLTGWTDSSQEKCWMIGYKGSIKGWDHPAARSGKYYFMTGWPSESKSSRYLYQDVNISSYKGKNLTFTAYLGGYGHNDQGGIMLELHDKNGKVISAKSSEMYAVSWGSWSKSVAVTLNVPSNAYTARAYLIGVLYEGSEADAYFDDLSLTVSGGTSKPGQVKNLKLTNKKVKRVYVTFKKVSDAKGYQIRVATKKSMSDAKKVTTSLTKGYLTNVNGKKSYFKKGKTYYVQVRAYKNNADGTKVYGKWSAKKQVKIKK